jgi:hypothetical protein
MSEESDVSGLVEKPGMFPFIHCPVFGSLADVPVEDGRPVED